MNKFILVAAIAFSFNVNAGPNDVYVDGYYKSDGTYVSPYKRSYPDNTPYNNHSYLERDTGSTNKWIRPDAYNKSETRRNTNRFRF